VNIGDCHYPECKEKITFCLNRPCCTKCSRSLPLIAPYYDEHLLGISSFTGVRYIYPGWRMCCDCYHEDLVKWVEKTPEVTVYMETNSCRPKSLKKEYEIAKDKEKE
jgi:hypothetical protein